MDIVLNHYIWIMKPILLQNIYTDLCVTVRTIFRGFACVHYLFISKNLSRPILRFRRHSSNTWLVKIEIDPIKSLLRLCWWMIMKLIISTSMFLTLKSTSLNSHHPQRVHCLKLWNRIVVTIIRKFIFNFEHYNFNIS